MKKNFFLVFVKMKCSLFINRLFILHEIVNFVSRFKNIDNTILLLFFFTLICCPYRPIPELLPVLCSCFFQIWFFYIYIMIGPSWIKGLARTDIRMFYFLFILFKKLSQTHYVFVCKFFFFVCV